MVKVGVLGATGFTGEKLVEILLTHPKVEVTYLASRTEKPVLYSQILPKFKGKTRLRCEPLSLSKATACCDFLFLALPHTVSMHYVPALLEKGKKVVDLSADYRLKPSLYKVFYKKDHSDKKNLKKAIYGLPELFKEEIKKAELVANPGCYPTSIILALYPLVAEGLIEGKVIADAKSAITGAGRKALLDFHYSNVNNNFWAYKPFVHQHQPEITQILKKKPGDNWDFFFLPQVASFEAGIYSVLHCSFKKKLTHSSLKKIYSTYYKGSPFVRVHLGLPKLKEAVGTNFCDLGFALDKSAKNGVVISSLDNLIKGAAGQAVENMNLMLGFKQVTGLIK